MRDPHVHAEKTSLPGFGHQVIRALITDAVGVAPDLPKTTGTGCGLRRPLASTSTVPEEITCLACREWLRGECLFWADAAARALELAVTTGWPGSPTAEDLRGEEHTYRALAARFEVAQVTGPQTYHEASGGNIADQVDRYRELADRDVMARSIATRKARGTYEPNKYVNDEKFPPLTAAEHLEMLALGERIARYYRHPSQVDTAVRAGASWAQIAAATGTTVDAARAAYREWAEGQHKYAGMDDAEYAAALERAGDGSQGGAP